MKTDKEVRNILKGIGKASSDRMEKEKTREDMKLHGLFGCRDTLEDAQEYMLDIINAMPKDERMPMWTGFYVFWNTLALNYDVTLKEQKESK